jgi:hypothetical protein
MTSGHAAQRLPDPGADRSGVTEFLAYRLATETFLRGVDLLNEAVGGNIAQGMLLNALWCLELRKTVPPQASLVLPAEWNAPMGIHELSRALDIPYSTVYRQLRQLIRRGIAVRNADRTTSISPDFVLGTAGTNLRRGSIASSIRLLLGLHRIGFLRGSVAALEGEAALSREQEDVIFRAGMETILYCLLLTAKFYDDLVTGLVFKLVATLNIKHLASQPQTAAVAALVPDELRRPVSVYNAARALHMPYETTRRISKQLLAKNAFRLQPNSGLIVPSQVHSQAENAEAQQASFQALAAGIAQLAHAGLVLRPARSS